MPQYQFLYSNVAQLTLINGSFTVDSDGSVTAFTGENVEGVHARPGHTPAGVYYIELTKNFQALVGFDWFVGQGTTGSATSAGSLGTGTAYKITTVGTTDWGSVGFYDEDFTAAVGSPFVATGTAAGTGFAIALTSSGIANIELLQPQSMLTNHTPGEGSNFIIKCYDYAGSAAFPAEGATVYFDLLLRASTVRF